MAIETPLATGPSDLPPGEKPPRRWPWFIGLLVLGLVTAAVALVVTRPSHDKTVESTTAATSEASAPEDAAIIKAYLDGWAAWDQVTSSLTESTDLFAATAVDPLLNFLRVQVADLRSKGIYYEKGGITHTNTHVVERSADRALLRDCMLDRTYGYNGKGERLPAPGLPGERTSMEAIALRDPASGVWKISSRYPQQAGVGACGA
jgi:hypothetical protein